MTPSFVRSVVRYACTCLSSSLPNNNGRPLFLSTSSFTAISLATCFLILRQFYLVLLPSSHTAVLERTARERFGKELYGRCYTVLCCPFPNTSLFWVKYLYAPHCELQAVFSLFASVLMTFFTSLLAAMMVDAGTTVDSKLSGIGSTEPGCMK